MMNNTNNEISESLNDTIKLPIKQKTACHFE